MEKHKMRRHDRNIENIDEINQVISKAQVIRLGLYDGTDTYIVPLNFGFEVDNGKHVFYMHCANEGRKLEIIKSNPKCSFELDVDHVLSTAKEACGWSMSFKSVMGTGTVHVLNTVEEKIHGLTVLMKQYDKSENPEYDFSKMLERTTVLKLTGESISCKVKE